MKEIDLGYKKKQKSERSQPYAIYYVYAEHENFIVKGMSDDVSEWLNKYKKNCDKYFYRYTYWKDGISRGGWMSSKDMRISRHPYNNSDFRKRGKYYISIKFNGTWLTDHIVLRRMPNKWIPEFDIFPFSNKTRFSMMVEYHA